MFQHAFSGIGNPFWHNDVQALKSLLNTPQPSGKLAHWGMALKIEHQSGKHNANADALSRRPLPESTDSIPKDRVVAQLSVGEEVIEPEPGEWGSCPPEDGCRIEATDWLPWDKSTSTQQEGCKMNSAGQCAIYPWGQCPLQGGRRWNTMGGSPSGSKESLFLEAHGGRFGAHLGDTKVYSELLRHYWWVGMWWDITQWTRVCVTCATRSVGRAVKPPTPIPVAGPFDRVGVDVIQFPHSHRGNQYAIVFVDYLTKWPGWRSFLSLTSLLLLSPIYLSKKWWADMGFHLRYSQIMGGHSCLDYCKRCSSYLGSRKPTPPLTIPKWKGWWKDLTEPSPPC